MDQWVSAEAGHVAARFERDLAALVAVSSPSGDAAAFEECAAVAIALAPKDASVERPACSSPDHAPDLLLRVVGGGDARLLLLGHLDTVHAHGSHRSLERTGDRWVGSGSVDMKGGDVLALAVLRALADRLTDFAEVALLLVAMRNGGRHRSSTSSGSLVGTRACASRRASSPTGRRGWW